MPGGSIEPDGGAAIQFITLKGRPQAQAMTVQDITRAGVDGHAYRNDAKRGRPFVMIGLKDYLNHSAAVTGYQALMALQGKIVTVTDDFGFAMPDTMVLEVEELALEPVLLSTGGLVPGSTRLSTMRFLMQNAAPPQEN